MYTRQKIISCCGVQPLLPHSISTFAQAANPCSDAHQLGIQTYDVIVIGAGGAGHFCRHRRLREKGGPQYAVVFWKNLSKPGTCNTMVSGGGGLLEGRGR